MLSLTPDLHEVVNIELSTLTPQRNESGKSRPVIINPNVENHPPTNSPDLHPESQAYLAIVEGSINRLIDFTATISALLGAKASNEDHYQAEILGNGKRDQFLGIRERNSTISLRITGILSSRFPGMPKYMLKRITTSVETRKIRLIQQRFQKTNLSTREIIGDNHIEPIEIRPKNAAYRGLYEYPNPPQIKNKNAVLRCEWCFDKLEANDVETFAWRYVVNSSILFTISVLICLKATFPRRFRALRLYRI